ncbi:MAG: peptidoglycan-associated lipoprotein Pal [Nitrospirae bacterium]|nr:peptidoglycan-associated lipoprotein Pal [Nitrospirota bacterium]
MKKWYYVILITVLAGVIISGCAKKATTKAEGELAAKPAVEEKAPAPKEAPTPAVEEKRLELRDAFFDFDKSNIREDAKAPLQNNAEFLRLNKNAKVVIEGHCDERGTIEYNIALGQRRADSVKRYLVNLGIDSARITTVSYGKERPFCKEHNENCYQTNRRAHFIVK